MTTAFAVPLPSFLVDWHVNQEPDDLSFQGIVRRRELTAVFQPILDMGTGTILGFEGLIRGPANSALHNPSALFDEALRCGMLLEFEMLCRHVMLESFARQKLPGRLFLNVSPSVLTDPSFKNGQTLKYMRQLGISPEQVTIEITEQEASDLDLMREALLHYRSMGLQIALDDLGAGYSSLRMWSELHPEFVKVDKHFVRNVDNDPFKLQFLRALQQIAKHSGCRIIAEGIETEAELSVIQSLGIALGQGYFIARPANDPSSLVSPSVRSVLVRQAGEELMAEHEFDWQ